MTPSFDSNVTSYTAETTNATNTITATPKDAKATVSIKNGDAEVENGSAATWSTGENSVAVIVTNGTAKKIYTVIVTKS